MPWVRVKRRVRRSSAVRPLATASGLAAAGVFIVMVIVSGILVMRLGESRTHPDAFKGTVWTEKLDRDSFIQDVDTGDVIWDSRSLPNNIIPNINGGGVGQY